MAFQEGKRFAEKHEQKDITNPIVKDKILKQEKNGKIPCAVAFEIVKESKISPKMVGMAIDRCHIKLTKCQLGLFGYKPHKMMLKSTPPVTPDLKDAIFKSLEEGRLSCKRAWEISSRLNIHKITVARACECLEIKINNCQLGAF